MRFLVATLLAMSTLSAGRGKQPFTGTITDDRCANDHSVMRMGPTDGECTKACIAEHGAVYVLHDGKDVYAASVPQTPERLAAQKVRVMGALDSGAGTVRAESITDAKRASP